ncbi:MAG: AtpZ/AtpI family protein [Pseudomonadota bacterium]
MSVARPFEQAMARDAGKDQPPSLEELSDRLDAAQAAHSPPAPRKDGAAMGRGFRIASELIAAFLVGGGLGWLADWQLETAPWGLLVGLGFGLAAGLRNANAALAEDDAARDTTPGTQ